MNTLLNVDDYLTYKLAVCANPAPGSLLAYLRYALQLLEFSFHGVPWFLFCFMAFFMNYAHARVLSAIFSGINRSYFQAFLKRCKTFSIWL
jgi:hypothetical protein